MMSNLEQPREKCVSISYNVVYRKIKFCSLSCSIALLHVLTDNDSEIVIDSKLDGVNVNSLTNL